ncbi:MAG: tetratricopeptide repeat protein [Chitinophagaceae bacterium]|nr:tetratricopeptide repeat protein [Chitinophagaceae bacterium]
MRILFLSVICLLSALKIEAQSAEEYFQQGIEKLRSGNKEDAVEFFSRSIELSPHLSEAWFLRGYARFLMNYCELAVPDFKQALSLNPDDYYASLMKGVCTARITDYEGALADFSDMIFKYPDSAEVYFQRGYIYEMLGKRDSACSDFTMATNKGYKLNREIMLVCEENPQRKNYILRLTKTVPTKDYGYSAKNPIKTGNGIYGGPENQRVFLNLLRDVNGKPVKYERQGSCCAYKSKNAPLGYALVDIYKITYTDESGNTRETKLYISMYDYEEPMIPVGFRTVQPLK